MGSREERVPGHQLHCASQLALELDDASLVLARERIDPGWYGEVQLARESSTAWRTAGKGPVATGAGRAGCGVEATTNPAGITAAVATGAPGSPP
jgi:hypothetical protein